MLNFSTLYFFYGLGIFLFGMSQLEKGMRQLSDARLKSWLQSRTNTTIESIATGAVTTALLQSSSMVSLLVLAFASAGLLPLMNAIGVMLGANLGTTMTGWLVATLGFTLDLEAMALPLLGVSAFVLATIGEKNRASSIALVGLGISLLLFGLANMKGSMEAIPEQWDVARLQGFHSFAYLLFGLAAAFLVQSSSAVMMMALSALSMQIIATHEAVAIVIGADLGTTSTTVLASLSGSPIKKKLALAHFVFNLIVDMGAYFFLLTLLPAYLALLFVDPLYQLVAFHSSINVIGLICFAPFLRYYTAWIDRFFNIDSEAGLKMWDIVPPTVVDAAVFALADATRSAVVNACHNAENIVGSSRSDGIDPKQGKAGFLGIGNSVPHLSPETDFIRGYENLKSVEGEILQYSLKIQEQVLSETQAQQLELLTHITRLVVYSNKTLKDIRSNLLEFRENRNKSALELYQQQISHIANTCNKALELLHGKLADSYIKEEIDELYRINDSHYEIMNKSVYSGAGAVPEDRTLISTQLNVNREVNYALRSILDAVSGLVTDTIGARSHWLEAKPTRG